MKRWLKRGALMLVTSLALLIAYGLLVEPRLILDERHYAAGLPGLQEDWVGAEVAVFADLQVGMWLANTNMVEHVVARVIDADPAAVLLAGDFVYSSAPDIPLQVDKVTALVAPLTRAGIPTYAVLGNHDYAAGAAEELTAALEQQGVDVLLNESATIPAPDSHKGGQQLYVVGLGPQRPGLSRPDLAFGNVPERAPRVVFMHNPSSFPAVPQGDAPLAVAGHTHCGQIALPGMPAWSYLQLPPDERVVVDGFAPQTYGAPGNRLFVTCGIGFSLVPLRIAAPPQLVFFELTSTP